MGYYSYAERNLSSGWEFSQKNLRFAFFYPRSLFYKRTPREGDICFVIKLFALDISMLREQNHVTERNIEPLVVARWWLHPCIVIGLIPTKTIPPSCLGWTKNKQKATKIFIWRTDLKRFSKPLYSRGEKTNKNFYDFHCIFHQGVINLYYSNVQGDEWKCKWFASRGNIERHGTFLCLRGGLIIGICLDASVRRWNYEKT